MPFAHGLRPYAEEAATAAMEEEAIPPPPPPLSKGAYAECVYAGVAAPKGAYAEDGNKDAGAPPPPPSKGPAPP